MPNELVLEPLFLFFGLLFTATISASVFRFLRIPYTVGLLVVGIALSALTEWFPTLAALNTVTLSSDLIMYVILPTLIFEAAINIDAKMLLKNLAPIMLLAVFGVLVSTIIIAAALYNLDVLPLGAALIFGALISATDPVAVIALFKELKANKRLTLLMDGESLFNDATAIVLFTVLVGMVGSGATSGFSGPLLGALGQFIITFFGGVLFGAFMGLIMVLLLKFSSQDRFAQRTQMIILAYMTFIIADHFLHLSGVMAVLVAGIIVSLNRHWIMDERRWENINIFWEYATFVANSFIFLMMGMTENKLFENLDHLFHILPILTITAAVVVAARAIIIFGLVPVSNRFRMADKINKGMQTVMFWGGLRGAVPIALMMALPEGMPGRELIFEMVLAMILVTLLMQGTTTGKLLNYFSLAGQQEESTKQAQPQSA